MKILLAGKHPPGGSLPIGGVQSWIATVAAELGRLGHQPVVWGPEWPLAGEFDAGVLANLSDTRMAVAACGRVLRVSHGIIPAESATGAGWAFTSEEVRDHWKGDGPILRQPLDLDFWSPGNGARTLLVRHSYWRGLDYLPRLAQSVKLSFTHLHDATPEVVRDTLRKAAVVVATGRAACEAMACGAAVVIADDRQYQGPLLDLNTTGAMARNYSGRGGAIPTPQTMLAAVVRAMEVGSLRSHAEAHHDARHVTARILECTSLK